ncbi:MAG: hypothetical protein A2X17_01300 [Bacteroidetes bacterium GWF2_41_61]|jgi:AraC-like DNA-binding protein|nr:MAG: hypothetical protein A2X17_01300 [Bacteroidetes bacterium GWF2_41_61]OFY91125.1 MAG: hypothetical protein A2266_01535 [Bacteroidetes bacterium RIFOXYA12_FULL_40_10]HBG24276.1 hypothetical protein [Rikenellaceae bacterium]
MIKKGGIRKRALYRALLRFTKLLKIKGSRKSKNSNHRNFIEIVRKSDELLNIKQLFLDQNFKIETLAREIGTNRTYLSRSIRYIKKENFAGYINGKRVEYAKSIIIKKSNSPSSATDEPAMSTEDFAIASGFGCKRTFVRTFKQREGVTPSQYRSFLTVRTTRD